MSAQEVETKPAIELIVEQDPNGQVAANVPVRWVISPEMVNTLAEKANAEPYMLLVVTSENNRELDRFLVPLKVGMTYLQLTRPGTLAIHATIVWANEGDDSVKSVVMAKDDYGNYNMALIHWFTPGLAALEQREEELRRSVRAIRQDFGREDELQLLLDERENIEEELNELRRAPEVFGLFDGYRAIQRTVENDRIEIVVPGEMFAPDPPRWMRWVGGLYKWPRKAGDQCDLRKRVLITLPTLPFYGAFWGVLFVVIAAISLGAKIVGALATAVLLLFGVRNLDYSWFKDWDEWEMKDIWYDKKPSYWWYRKVVKGRWETKYERRNPAFDYINPPFALLVFVVNLVFNNYASLLQSALLGVATPLVAGGLAFVASKLKKPGRQKKELVVTQENKDKLARELLLLTHGSSASLADLPARQRTIKLRYLHLKASVCKPFAK